jgi:hypothetical protein
MILTPDPMLTSKHGNCAGVGLASNDREYCGGLGEGRGKSSSLEEGTAAGLDESWARLVLGGDENGFKVAAPSEPPDAEGPAGCDMA